MLKLRHCYLTEAADLHAPPACSPRPGPRRSALDSVQRGGGGSASAARRARQRYTARCHVYDICQTLEASMRHPRPGAAYNIADDDPADRATVMAYAAELLERRAAGLPLQAAAAGDGPGGWAVPVSSMSAAASGASSSGSYDSGDESGLLSAALRPRDRGAASGRLRRSDARQAAAAAAAVREELAEKRVRRGLGWGGVVEAARWASVKWLTRYALWAGGAALPWL